MPTTFRFEYTPWKSHLIWQRPTTGSCWYTGNFKLGLMIDSHPQFFNIIIGLLVFEIGVGWTRDCNVIYENTETGYYEKG